MTKRRAQRIGRRIERFVAREERVPTPEELRTLLRMHCECEHEDHLRGESGHEYLKTFELEDLTFVDTIYGEYAVCDECRDDCLRGVIV